MVKSELLKILIKQHGTVRPADVEYALDIFFAEMTDRLANGGRVEIRGFGTFSTRGRIGRKSRNPKTGVPVDVRPKRYTHFRPSKKLLKRLND